MGASRKALWEHVRSGEFKFLANRSEYENEGDTQLVHWFVLFNGHRTAATRTRSVEVSRICSRDESDHCPQAYPSENHRGESDSRGLTDTSGTNLVAAQCFWRSLQLRQRRADSFLLLWRHTLQDNRDLRPELNRGPDRGRHG